MQVDDLMNAPVYSVSPEDTVAHVKNVMLKQKIGRVAVAYEGTLVGVIAKYDLVKMLGSSEPGWRRRHQDRTLAKTIMSENLVTTSPNTSIVGAAREMITNGIGCLPVVKDGELLGILTDTDLVTHFASKRRRAAWHSHRHGLSNTFCYYKLKGSSQNYYGQCFSHMPPPSFNQPRFA